MNRDPENPEPADRPPGWRRWPDDARDDLDPEEPDTESRPPLNLGPESFDMDRPEGDDSGGRWMAHVGRWMLIIATLGLVLPAILVVLVSRGGESPPESPLPTRNLVPARVTSVIDGNTISVMIAGRPEVVRYIGVETPGRGDLLHDISVSANERWVGGQEVLLEADKEMTNAEGHLLRYVWIEQAMINAALIVSGLGRHVNESPNSRYAEAFEELEANARTSEFGIWDPDYTGA